MFNQNYSEVDSVRKGILITAFVFFAAMGFMPQLVGQEIKKQAEAFRIIKPPSIDGELNEAEWLDASPATNFYQYDPYNGPASNFKTEVRILYDDKALYIGAIMYDNSPDSILTELGFRDASSLNADYFSIDLNTYNDGLNVVSFGVTASGVQFDIKETNDDDDQNWSAVWLSKVSINELGWVAEIKIPYSALRFPEVDDQTWGLNIWRSIRRLRQMDSWNFVDKEIEGKNRQAGELVNLKNIKAPLRLSFTPYVSGYLEKQADDEKWDYSFNYGMDLKYGISESFTLDMTLIPDFGQVQSDDEIFNLSPFEVYYSEKRPFFTEGTELFDKGDIFYSRRVGDTPDGYGSVEDSLQEGEYIKDNPSKNKLINATKISGRTSKGLGIGVFNAMSAATFATISDSVGNERTVETQPFSNYNMLVFDQNLKNNSYLSLYNSNVYKSKDYYMANVTGTEFQLNNKASSYALFGRFNLSQKYFPTDSVDLGYSYIVSFGKTSGNFRFDLNNWAESDTYDPNDLGFLRTNNSLGFSTDLEYNIYDPFGIVLNWSNEIDIWYEMLYSPRKFKEFGINGNSRVTFINRLTVGTNFFIKPVDEYDYYEPRTDGRVYISPPAYNVNMFLSPDYRKAFIVDLRGGYGWSPEYNQQNYSISVSPRWRVNDKLTFRLTLEYDVDDNDIGYVDDIVIDDVDEIVFGQRDLQNVENVLQTSYIINNNLALDFRLRHYWLKARYDQFYLLTDDGYLEPSDYGQNNDFNFNAFNIDMVLRWQFAPGSELAFAWKNNLLTFEESDLSEKYFNNLQHVLESPSDNSFSLKVLYYLDYLYLKRKK